MGNIDTIIAIPSIRTTGDGGEGRKVRVESRGGGEGGEKSCGGSL